MRTEIEQLVDTVGLKQTEVVCRVHRTTVSRWLRGEIAVPHTVLLVLRLLAWGQHPREDRAWEGWFFRRGQLVSPNNDCFDPGEVAALRWSQQVIKAQQRRIAELEAQVERMARDVALTDPAANDLSVWVNDPRTKIFSGSAKG